MVRSSLKYNVFYRCTVIVWMVVKFILQQYFFHMWHRIWDEQTYQKWNALLKKQAREYRENAIKLGGVLIKVGQFLSTRTDFMPDVFIKELAGLVDRVPAIPYSYAKASIESEWNSTLQENLMEIDESPIAAASIGQVYKAKLTDGTVVAIKVQRYRIDDIFHMDFKALKIVFWLISVFTGFGKKANLDELYRELIYVMERELDFEKELGFGKYFKERYQEYETIHIPNYYEELCTKKVLVMEWIEGAKITNINYMNRHNINIKQTAKTLFDFYLDQFLNSGYFHADPHAGNILIQSDGRIAVIDFGMMGEVRKQDTQYFKRLIQGLIMDDYEKIINTLDEMNFVLPNANRDRLKKMIKQTVEMYENGSFKQMDSHTIEQVKEDIREFIKEQPIQLSADYAYLGRAASIVFGVLIEIYPDIDFGKWAKPKITEWFGGSIVGSIYKQFTKETLQPILSYPKAMLNWLESGEENRKWEKEKQQKQQLHHFYLLLEILTFTLIIGGISLFVYATSMGLVFLKIIGEAAVCILSLTIIIIFLKHYRMIRLRK
ncbi:ABC1 kinase family protein [Virgibacillus ndiopensis]|uniref:ABC1 kinase family protein n=1 Tax=Virgibacillus ndiopensis TaxID=2004408 RepID=UPI003CCC0A01